MDFIIRFHELLLTQPRYNVKHVNVENSDYSDTVIRSRNCYHCFGAFYSEDLLYARYSRRCTSSCGMTFCVGCEGCVECVDCVDCYDACYLRNCKSCSDCRFCDYCFSCENCLGCVGLYRKNHCLFNEQLSAGEYEERVAKYDLCDRSVFADIRRRVATLKANVPLPALDLLRCENSLGNHLVDCNNCLHCYDSFAMEDCLYVAEANGNRSSCDLTVCFESELCYSCIHSPLNYDCNFLYQTDSSLHSEFCAFSKNLRHCFGCVALANRDYCILNEQHSRESYERATAELRRELIAARRYDLRLFFASPYEHRRRAEERESAITIELQTGEATMTDTFVCENEGCSRSFRVIPQEAQFYERKHLPRPAHCSTCRHRDRMALRTERQLYRRTCERCERSILSVYPLDAPYRIYCQECFWRELG